MVAYAGMTLVARYTVPRYGARQVLFLEMAGAIFVLGIVLPLADIRWCAAGRERVTFVTLLALGPLCSRRTPVLCGAQAHRCGPDRRRGNRRAGAWHVVAFFLWASISHRSAGSAWRWPLAEWPADTGEAAETAEAPARTK